MLVVSGRPFARALVAPTLAWMIPAAILFGGNGMTAQGAVSVLRSSLAAWAVVVVGFAALTANAVAAALHAKGVSTLRSLRPSRAAMLAPLGALLVLAQAPLFVLFARAGHWGAAVLHAALALSLELLFVRLASIPRPAFLTRTGRARTPLAAMCVCCMQTLWRREQASVSLSGTAMALGGGALWLSFQNDPPRSALGRIMCVLAVPLSVVAALLVRPLVREEAALGWLLRSTRTRAWVPALAMAAVVSLPSAAWASGAAMGVKAGAGGTAGALLFGGLVALAVVAWARRHARTRKQDPATFVVGTIGIAVAAIVVGVTW